MKAIQSVARRNLLCGLALAPAAVAISPPQAAASSHPDAGLLDLGQRWEIARAEARRLWNRAEVAEERSRERYPATPGTLIVRPDDYFHSLRPSSAGLGTAPATFTGAQVTKWRNALADGRYAELMSSGAKKRFEDRAREIVAAWDDHLDAKEAVSVSVGLRSAEAAAGAADRALQRIEEQIFAVRAATLEGFRVKARILADFLGDAPDGTYEDALARNLLADLLDAPKPSLALTEGPTV
jgi:hypothetical protein